MANLGTDFNKEEPTDSSLVKLGAQWIRDIKWRIKSFVSVSFDPETGLLKEGVVPEIALPNSGVVPGTYSKITVNAKGLATLGENELVEKTLFSFKRAVFSTVEALIDTDTGVLRYAAAEPAGVYSGSVETNTYKGVYPTLAGSRYRQYELTVPPLVTRMRVMIMGGGGGLSVIDTSAPTYRMRTQGTTDTVLNGYWDWAAVDSSWTFPPETQPTIAASWRVKLGALMNDCEKLRFDSGSNGSITPLLKFMLPGLLIKNRRTQEIVRIVAFSHQEAGPGPGVWNVERKQNGSPLEPVNDGDEWDITATMGGAGGEYVEGTLPVTPGQPIDILVGHGGAAGQNGAPTAVSTDSAHLEAGGGACPNGSVGGLPVPGSKSLNVGYFAAPGLQGALTTGGRSGSHYRAKDGFYGDGAGYMISKGIDGLAIVEWVQ